jgi:hypothetical protein
MPIFLVILSVGSISLFRDLWGLLSKAFAPRLHRRAKALVAAVLLLVVIPLPDLVHMQISDRHGYVRFTNEHHDRVAAIVEFLESESSPQDALVATGIIITPLRLVGADLVEDPERVLGYGYTDPNRHESVRAMVERHASGFIVIDARRAGWTTSLPREDFWIMQRDLGGVPAGVCVRSLDRIDGNWIWVWDHSDRCPDSVDFEAWLADRT